MTDASGPEPPAAPPVSEIPMPVRPERRAGLRRFAVALGAVLLFAAVAVLIARWTRVSPLASENDTESVAQEWKSTIGRLGIDPVYPPTEDVVVGDISVMVVWDSAPNGPHRGKAAHVARIDMSKALEQTYRSGPTFPDTAPKPKTDGEMWQQQAASGSVFASGAERRHLPLVLLPAFTIARVRNASAGGGWSKLLGAVEGEGQSTVELKIPAAETYGVPTQVARQHLETFCKDPNTRKVCTQDGAREELVDRVGSDVFDRQPCPDEKAAPKPCLSDSQPYRLDVEVALIYRVYLIRSIETVTRSSSSFGAQAKVAQVGQAVRQLQATVPKATDGPASQNPDEAAAVRRALDEHKARLDALAAQVSGTPGGAAGFYAGDASSVSVTQNLQRPVVIGFRAVRKPLE